jgi:hypothetical protein
VARTSRLLLLLVVASCGKVQTLADAPEQGQPVTLIVNLGGNGGGSVTSSPGGISCAGAGSCSLTVPSGTSVSLTAVPDATSVFTGWNGGGCTGAGPCTLTVDTDLSIEADFAKAPVTVTVQPAGNGTGSVTSSPAGITCGSTCSATFDYGTQVTLTATADASSTFLGWTGGGCTGTGPCMFTATADTTVQASFALDDTLVVTRGGTGTGTVTSSDGTINCGTACSHQYTPGAVVTLTAAPGTQSTFTRWSGACSGTGTCTVTIDKATMVTATFTLNQYTLMVSKTGNGAGTVTSSPAGISCGATCSSKFDAGTAVTLTAAPSAGSTFTGWGGACSGTGMCTVTINAAASVTAMFTLQQVTLSVTKSGNGTVTSSPAGISCGGTCSGSFNYGATVTLTAVPGTGSQFAGWGGACSGTSTCVVTLDAATSVTATFTLQQITLQVSKTGSGAGTVASTDGTISCGGTCSASYPYGTTVTLTASPQAGSTFAGWTTGGCSGTSSCVVTLTAATTVTAVFTQNVTLVVQPGGNGSGSVTSTDGTISCGAACSASYPVGTTVTLSAAPAGSSDFAGWGGPCSGTSTCVVTLDAGTTVTATFTLKRVTLSVGTTSTVNGSGSVTSTDGNVNCGTACSAVYDYGTVVTVTANPSNGSTFAGWTGGGCGAAATCAIAMTANTNVSAAFTCGAVTFNYVGGAQTYTAPGCARQVHIEAFGAQGATGLGSVGGPNNLGGLGGYAEADLAVAAGDQLIVMVGGQKGFNGGGAGFDGVTVGNGGDASDVRTSAGARLVIAGGGGGGVVTESQWRGGDGGGGVCGTGWCGGGGGQGFGGAGGPGSGGGGAGVTATDAGGAGGGGNDGGGRPSCETRYQATPGLCGTIGNLYAGGAGDSQTQKFASNCYSSFGGTAGGGGGFFGGGGSSVGNCGGGGGGGGSSKVFAPAANPVFKPGVQKGLGQVVITPF